MVRFSIFAKNGTDMEDKLISRYDILVNRYKELVSEKLSRKDFIEYNEILFSAHSCAIAVSYTHLTLPTKLEV